MKFCNIRTLCVPGIRVNEDSFSASERHLLAMDGASGLYGLHLTEEASDARWLAQRGAQEYGARLAGCDGSMAGLCREAALALGTEFSSFLEGGTIRDVYPSAGVAALRLRAGLLEYYSLGDLTILLRFRDGHVETIHDPAITNLDNGVLREMVRLARERGESVAEQRPRVQELLQKNRRMRNRPGGYWIFDPTAEGADRGLSGSWPAAEVCAAALLSDGIADAVPVYHMEPDYGAFLTRLEREGPEAVCAALRKLQQEDPAFDRYPRFKQADDATILMAELREEQ